VLWTTLRVAALCTVTCVIMVCRSLTCWRAAQSRFKNVLIMAGGAAAVRRQRRARGRVDDLFGSRVFSQRHLMQFGVITEPLQIMYTRARRCRHHCRQSALHGADLAELIEASTAMSRRPLQSRAGHHDVSSRAVAAVAAGHPQPAPSDLNPRHEAYATLSCSAAQIQDDGPLVYGQFQLNNWPFGASSRFVLMAATLG